VIACFRQLRQCQVALAEHRTPSREKPKAELDGCRQPFCDTIARMKWHGLGAIVLCVCQIGCNKNGSSPAQQTQQTAKPDDAERTTCEKLQLQHDGCGEYKVLFYDSTWENEFGNKGAFVLEREGLTIHAHCGSEDCSDFSGAVGKVVIADKSIGSLISRYEPLCEDPEYLKTALGAYKRNTGRDANWAKVCQTTLIVEKIEVKPMPKN